MPLYAEAVHVCVHHIQDGIALQAVATDFLMYFSW